MYYKCFQSLLTDFSSFFSCAQVKVQTEANLFRIKETNRIELENMEDTLRRQHEEDQVEQLDKILLVL